MPHQIVCPKCGMLGLVRVEHIIRGNYATRRYECGGCEYAWMTPEAPPPPAKPVQPRWSSKVRRVGGPKPERRPPD